MTEDEARDIVARIGESIVGGTDVVEETEEVVFMESACAAAAREMGLDHEYWHTMVNTFGVVAPHYGVTAESFCFIMGRKWGLMEAEGMLSGGVPDAPE